MSNLIFDSNDNDYARDSIILGKNSEKIITIKIKCLTNYFLKVDEQFDGAIVYGRLQGIGNYVDLESSPIDLTEFNNQTKTFEIKISTSSPISNFVKLPIELKVSFNGN